MRFTAANIKTPATPTAAVYAFCVWSTFAYMTAELGLYSVYTVVYTRICIIYGCVHNNPNHEQQAGYLVALCARLPGT